jgi:MFS family permease
MGCMSFSNESSDMNDIDIFTGVGGAPMVLGGGTIADLIPRNQRGTAMAIWMIGPSNYLPVPVIVVP